MSLVMYTSRPCSGLFTPYGSIDKNSQLGDRPFFPVYLPSNKRVQNQFLESYIQTDLDKIKSIDMNLIADFTSMYFSNGEKKGKAQIYHSRFDVIDETDIIDILCQFAYGVRPSDSIRNKINDSRVNPANYESWFVVEENIMICYNGVLQQKYVLVIDSPIIYNVVKTKFSYRAIEHVMSYGDIVNDGDQHPMLQLSNKVYSQSGYFVPNSVKQNNMGILDDNKHETTIYKVKVVKDKEAYEVHTDNQKPKLNRKNKIDQKPVLLVIEQPLRSD